MTIIRLLGIFVVSAGLAGGALAQTAGTPNPNQAIEQQIETRTGTGAPPEGASIGSGAVVEWVGKPLAAIDGTKVGTVSEVRTDQTGAVTEIRAKVGGLFGLFAKEVAIPAALIILEQDGALVAEMSADDIRQSPSVSG